MEKKILLGLLLPLWLSGVSLQPETKLSDGLFISKISDKVFIVTHYFPWPSNSLIVKASETEVVLVDTPYETSATCEILDWVDNNLAPKKITAINTGYHIDNLGGNGCLLGRGIDVYGSETTARLVEERGEEIRQQSLLWLKAPGKEKFRKVYETIKFEKPNKLFPIDEGLSCKIGDIDFEVFFPGESHAPDNVTVYIKGLDILFGGCMIKSKEGKNLGFTGDANLEEWPKSIKRLQEKYPAAKLVIPHHGEWGDSSLLEHTLNLLAAPKTD